jgi:hypothetical protein
MSEMRIGYGSEWQLFRLFARHRKQWDKAVQGVLEEDGVTDIDRVEWADFPYSEKATTKDQEIMGMDFLQDGEKLTEWKKFWPDPKALQLDRKGIHTWDAVGQLVFSNCRTPERLLVEAKSHTSELKNSPPCGAGEPSRKQIATALKETYSAMGFTEKPWEAVEQSWLGKGCYQIANRLASLHFLRNRVKGTPARLLFVYFLNDPYFDKDCPTTPARWKEVVQELADRMCITSIHTLNEFIHYLYIDVRTGERVLGGPRICLAPCCPGRRYPLPRPPGPRH